MGMTSARRRLAVALFTGVAALGYSAGTAGITEAAAPGLIVFTNTAPLPQYPCSSCNTSITGTGIGAIHGAGNFVAKTLNDISGSASYFESGCPPLSGTANGTLTMAMVDGTAPAHFTFNFHYQRTGLVAVITGTGTVADNSGAHATNVKGSSVALFTAKASPSQLKPPCTPAPLTVTVTGVLVTQ
jgi:hypothetical protein